MTRGHNANNKGRLASPKKGRGRGRGRRNREGTGCAAKFTASRSNSLASCTSSKPWVLPDSTMTCMDDEPRRSRHPRVSIQQGHAMEEHRPRCKCDADSKTGRPGGRNKAAKQCWASSDDDVKGTDDDPPA